MWQIILGFIMLPVVFTQIGGIRKIAGLIYLSSGFWLDWHVTPRGNLEIIACVIFSIMGYCLIMSSSMAGNLKKR